MNRLEIIYQALYHAAELSFLELFRCHQEHYYYAALIMMDAASPCITAMSEEVFSQLGLDFRWSYAESPYTGFAHKKYFKDVDELYNKDIWDDQLDDNTFERRVKEWKKVMVQVMKALSESGLFDAYAEIFINAESYPPEGDFNSRNAKKLNSDAVYKRWRADNDDEETTISEMWEVWHPRMCSITLIEPLPSKTIALRLRKEFASPLCIGEFIKRCGLLPFVINEEFRYSEAQEILSSYPEYAEFLSIKKLPSKTEAIPF